MCHHGFAAGKKDPLSDEKVTVGNHDFVDVGTGCHLNRPHCSCNEREGLVLCLRCLLLAQHTSDKEL